VSSEIQSALLKLEARVKRLEESERPRTKRGRCNKREAAEYLGKSREWLRQRERRGDGPECNPDGSYDYDKLDAFEE
jgi:hypothetical protein